MKYLQDEQLTKLTSQLAEATLGRSRSIHGRIEAYTTKRAGTDKKYAHALGKQYVAEMESVDCQLADYKTFLQKHSRLSTDKSSGSETGRKRSMSTGSQLEATKPAKQHRRSNSFNDSLKKNGKIPVLSSAFHQNSALGDFGEMGTRRLMTDLILTLNASFPDYDFASVRPSDFEKISVANSIKRINERLAEFAVGKMSFVRDLWSSMNEAVHLADCDVYSYAPKTQDQDDDPLSFLTQTLIDQSADQSSDSAEFSSSRSTVLWTFNYFFVNKSLKRIVIFTCVECMRNVETLQVQDEDEDEASFVKFRGTEAADLDFDMDPSHVAGGIPISI